MVSNVKERKKRKRSTSSSSASNGGRVVAAEESQLVREKVDGYFRGQPDPEQGDQSCMKTASFVKSDAPIRCDRRKDFVWVVKAGAQKGKSKYTLDSEDAYIDPRDKERVKRHKLRCDVCGNLLRRPYRVRCFPRRSARDPPEIQVDRKMEAEVYLVGHRCMKGLLGIPGEARAPRSKLRLDIRKTLLNGTIFQMEDLKSEVEEAKEFKETEIVQALHIEVAKVISECAGPEAAWRQAARPRDVGIRSGANCRAFEQRPINDEEDVTEDETLATKPPTKPKKKRAPKQGKEGKEQPEPEKDEAEERLLPEPPKPGRFSKKYQSMLPSVAARMEEMAAPHKLYAQVLPGFSRPPYVVVIPTYGRPDRLVNETLAFLKRQKIPQKLIEIWLAPGHAPGQKLSERERYEKVLAQEWRDVHIRIGVKGVMEQRWRIGLEHPEGTHIVSFDDDVPEVFEKVTPGTSSDTMQPLPPGSLEAIIHHARDLMHQEGCYIWGLAPSANPMNLVVNRISRRNGMVNGFAYGYLNRHDEQFQSIYCSPTEDVERSCRFYESDAVLLRYLQYAARTKFKAPDGISLLYADAVERKKDEEQCIVKISAEFPHLLQVRTGERRRKSAEAMNFTFISIGQGPLYPNGVQTRARPVEAVDAKEKVKLTKQAEDEKELLDKCVQIQEFLIERQEAMEEQPKSEVSNVQKLLQAVIKGAQAEKVSQTPMVLPAPAPPAPPAPAAALAAAAPVAVQTPGVPLGLAPLAPMALLPGEGAVTPQHVLMASSLAKAEMWKATAPSWMTMAPVTPPELRRLALAVSDEEEASPGTPPLDLKESDDELQIIAVVPPPPAVFGRLVPPNAGAGDVEASLHPEPVTFSDLEDDDLGQRLQDFVK